MHPPEKLQLVGGPWWSPDGTCLAVEAENRPAGHHQAYAAAVVNQSHAPNRLVILNLK